VHHTRMRKKIVCPYVPHKGHVRILILTTMCMGRNMNKWSDDRLAGVHCLDGIELISMYVDSLRLQKFDLQIGSNPSFVDAFGMVYHSVCCNMWSKLPTAV
jgi:hypothetical protein